MFEKVQASLNQFFIVIVLLILPFSMLTFGLWATLIFRKVDA